MATYRCTDGLAKYVDVPIAQCKSWAIDDAMEVIPETYKGIKHAGAKGGITSGTAQVVCDLDKATGQEDLLELIATATPAGTPGDLKLYIDADQYLSVNALFVGFSIGSGESGLVQATYNFVLAGQIDVTNL